MTKYLSIIVLILGFISCTTHEMVDDYTYPTIKIDTCIVKSSNSFDIVLQVNKGEGFKKHSLTLSLYDVNDYSNEMTTVDVSLGKEQEQTITQTVTVPKSYHNYVVYATLETQKNTFKAGPVRVYLANADYQHMYGTPSYHTLSYITPFCNDEIGEYVNPGDWFIINLSPVFSTVGVKVRIGNTVVDDVSNVGDSDLTMLRVKVPEDIQPGTYDVSLLFGWVDMPMPSKLCVMPWKTTIEEIDENAALHYTTIGSFRLGDKMYYLSDSTDVANAAVYDIQNNTWKRLSNIPGSVYTALSCNGRGYYISGEGHLYQYNTADDSWTDLGDMPTDDKLTSMACFSIGNKIYVAGGYLYQSYLSTTTIHDTWCYDTEKKTWTKVADMPKPAYSQTSLGADGYAYVLNHNGELWSYHASADSWKKETIMPQTTLTPADNAAIIIMDGKLVVYQNAMGTEHTVSTYDPSTMTWELKTDSNNDIRSNFVPGIFYYNGQVTVGPLRYAGYTKKYYYFLHIGMK